MSVEAWVLFIVGGLLCMLALPALLLMVELLDERSRERAASTGFVGSSSAGAVGDRRSAAFRPVGEEVSGVSAFPSRGTSGTDLPAVVPVLDTRSGGGLAGLGPVCTGRGTVGTVAPTTDGTH